MKGKVCDYYPPQGGQVPVNFSNYVDDSLSIQGTLYIKNMGSKIKILSEECSISLSIKDEKTYFYVLNIENDDKTEWDYMQFKINVDTGFKKFLNNLGNNCIMWQKELTFYILELFSDEAIIQNTPIFLDKLATLITSNDFQKPISEALTEETRKDYILNYDQIENLDKFLDDNFKELYEKQQAKKLEDKMKNLSLNIGVNKTEFMNRYKKYQELYIAPGKSFKYNKEKQDFDQIDDGESLLKVIDTGNFNYLLVIEKRDTILVSSEIKSKNTITINSNPGCLTFLSGGKAYSFGFNTSNIKEINNFEILINKCIYENLNKMNYEKLSQDIKDYIDFKTIYEDEEEDDQSEYKKITYDFDTYQEMNTSVNDSSAKNKFITQNYKNDRAFVVKDDNTIDVYNTNNDNNEIVCQDKLEPFKTKDLQEKNINISGVKMFSGDTKMLFKDSTTKDSIWEYDIGKEQVISEWKCGDEGKDLIDFTYKTKYGHLDDYCQIIGINKNEVFELDGRTNRKNKKVDSKVFKTNPGFTCVCTPGFEVFATGSQNGYIRLYKELNNAKTLIPCYGDPIRALDITRDGKYILATCDSYLMVIDVTNKQNENGFTKAFKRYRKKPVELKVPADVLEKFDITEECYSPAKFNLSKSGKETTITSSLGQYIIVWNFEEVKKGNIDSYKITNVSEFVKDNTTKFDKDQLLIAMPNKIRVQNEKLTDA